MSKYRVKSNTTDQLEPALSQADFHELLYQQIRVAVRSVLEMVMKTELSEFLAAGFKERTDERQGQRNGYYHRDFNTVAGSIQKLKVPRDRAGQFHTQVFERYERNDESVTAAIAQMFFSGVSQAKIGEITEPLMGVHPSPSTVSRLAHDLDSECEAWRNRPLAEHYRIIYLDAVYFPILHESSRDQSAVLVALGVDMAGDKEVLAVKVGNEESRSSWESFLFELQKRGVSEVDLVVTDGDAGLIGAISRVWPSAKRQRCLLHKMRNVLAHIPKRKKKEVGEALSGIFAAEDAAGAKAQIAAFKLRYEKDYPEAVKCLLEDEAACLTYYQFGKALRRHIRTTNPLESLFSTIRRRTNSMGVFQTEQSCLLMFWAVVKSTKLKRIPVA